MGESGDSVDDESASGSDSNNDGDTNSSEESSEGSNGSGANDSNDADGSADSNSVDDSVDSDDVDDCVGISADDCNEQYDGEGNQLCAQNIQTEECYEVVQSRGVYGRGGFDSGYNAAQETAAA